MMVDDEECLFGHLTAVHHQDVAQLVVLRIVFVDNCLEIHLRQIEVFGQLYVFRCTFVVGIVER